MTSKNKRGYFVVLEGIDSSGKKTQSKKLVKRLKELGKEVIYADFPTYEETKFGKLVSKYLRGEFGKKEEIPFEVRCMLYAADRYQFKETYKKYLEEGKIIVSNRYTESNMGFQPAEFPEKERKKAVQWIEVVESRLPQADLVILLNMPPKIAYKLLEQKGLRNYLKGLKRDIHEDSLEFQEKVAQNYLKIAMQRPWWVVVECVRGGILKTEEEIFSEVWAHVEKLIS